MIVYTVEDKLTFFEKINPLIKIILFLLTIVIAFIPVGFTGSLVLCSFVFLFVLIARIPLKTLLKLTIPFVILTGIVLIINMYIALPPNADQLNPWFYIGSRAFYADSFEYTLNAVVRIYTILLMGTFLVKTTSSYNLTQGLIWLLHPLKYLKVPIETVALILQLMLKFIPEFGHVTKEIRYAQEAKGLSMRYGTFKDKLEATFSLFLPLIVYVFKSGITTEEALLIRGYNKDKKYTHYKKIALKIYDFIPLFVIFCLITLLVLSMINVIPDFANFTQWISY